MSLLHDEGIVEAQVHHQNAIFEAAVQLPNHRRAGKRPRDPRRHRRGARSEGNWGRTRDPVQPQRARTLRYGVLRSVLRGQLKRLRLPRSSRRRRTNADAADRLVGARGVNSRAIRTSHPTPSPVKLLHSDTFHGEDWGGPKWM